MRAFTLVEIIVAITVVAVVVAVAVPTFLGLRDEAAAREPLEVLAGVVSETRERAMAEGRAFEIVFDRDGFYAMPRAAAYGDREALRDWFGKLEDPPEAAGIARAGVGRTAMERGGQSLGQAQVQTQPRPALAAPGAAGSEVGAGAGFDGLLGDRGAAEPFLRKWEFPEQLAVELLFWGDPEWLVLEGEVVRRWVFQPSGMVHPVRVRFERGGTFFEAGFDVLTGATTGERSSQAPVQRGGGEA